MRIRTRLLDVGDPDVAAPILDGEEESTRADSEVRTRRWPREVVEADVQYGPTTGRGNGPQRCAAFRIVTLEVKRPAAERERLVSTSTALYLTYEPEGYDNLAIGQQCALPATTERLVVQLWDRGGGPGSGAFPLLRKEFDYTYVFTAQ